MPIESRIHAFQADYYGVIAACHGEGSSDSLIAFMLDKIDETLAFVLDQTSAENAYFSEHVRRLLEVMEYDMPYTAAQIMAKLNLKSKETLRKNYINPALENQLIVMGIPDKPTSGNQTYRKK